MTIKRMTPLLVAYQSAKKEHCAKARCGKEHHVTQIRLYPMTHDIKHERHHNLLQEALDVVATCVFTSFKAPLQ